MNNRYYRFVCFGDSLAAQRDDDSLTNESRWPFLVQKSLNCSLLDLSRPYRTTNDLKSILNADLSDTDYLIIQLGIVDCAPRRFSRLENAIIYRLPAFITKRIMSFLKKMRIQSNKRVYVQKDQFKVNITNIIERYPGNILYVKILPATNILKQKNPLINDNIIEYNKILDELELKYKTFQTVEIHKSDIDSFTLDDGYHLSKKGHVHLSKLIISKFLKN